MIILNLLTIGLPFNYGIIFYYIIVNANKNFFIYLKFFCKNLSVIMGKGFNFFIIFKKNFFFKNNNYKSISKKTTNNKLRDFYNTKYFSNLHNVFIKKFKFLNIQFLLNFKTIIIKNILNENFHKNDAVVDIIFFKKYNILSYNLFNTTTNLFTNLNNLYYFKFKQFKLFNYISKNIHSIYKYSLKFKKKKKIFEFFFNIWDIHVIFEKIFLPFLKNKLYRWRKQKKIFFLKKKYRFKRFRYHSYLFKNNYVGNKVAIKKNFFLLQFFYYNAFLSVKIYLKKTSLFIFKNFKKSIYISRHHFNKLSRTRRFLGNSFWFFKKHWYYFLKKSFYFFKNFIIFKKFNLLKYTYSNNYIVKQLNTVKFSIYKRIFLTAKIISNNVLQQYYRNWKFFSKNEYLKVQTLGFNKLLRKKNQKQLIFLNFDKPLLGKLRQTRKLHWFLVKNGKLNARKYKNFLNKYIDCNFIKNKNYSIILLFFQTFNKIVSWHHVNLLLNYNLVFINGLSSKFISLEFGDLLESTISMNQNILFGWYKKNDKKYNSRIKRWSYLNYCRFLNSTLKKKKKLPKVLKKLPISFKLLSNYWLIDYSSGCGVFNRKDYSIKYSLEYENYYSSVTKLYNWRYVP